MKRDNLTSISDHNSMAQKYVDKYSSGVKCLYCGHELLIVDQENYPNFDAYHTTICSGCGQIRYILG